MRVRPISRPALLVELAGLFAAERPGAWLRVAVDGAPAADPGGLAAGLVDLLRERGRPALHVPAAGFLRPASLRLEFGRYNPDAFYTDWLDESGLRREVLDPTAPGGPGRVLPVLFDAARDRAARAPYRQLEPGAVVLVSGALLLGGGLRFDRTVHLALTRAALTRRTPAEDAWTLPAYTRYAEEVDPASFADVVVKCDDLRHPALVEET